MDMYTLLHVKWMTNKDLLHSTRDSAQCYVAAWMGGVWGKIDTRVWMVASLRCSPETAPHC